MKDRVPLYPGRVNLVPVAGQENTYDMTRADQPTQAGDPLNKATLWSDATAALFGLGVDSVPDDGLKKIGASGLSYVDGVRKTISEYQKGETAYLNIGGKKVPFIVCSKNYDGGTTHAIILNEVSEMVIWDADGSTSYDGSDIDKKCQEFVESLPSELKQKLVSCSVVTSVSANTTSTKTIQRNCVVPSLTELSYTSGQYSQKFNKEGTSFGLPELQTVSDGAGTLQRTFTRSVPNNVAGQVYYLRPEKQITKGAPNTQQCFRPVLFVSEDYSGEFFDYKVPPKIQLFNGASVTLPSEQLDNRVQIENGYYIGTGNYGSANRNSLSFSFSPAFLIITRDNKSPTPSDGHWINSAIWTSGATEFRVGRPDDAGKNTVEVKDTTISWYADNGSANIQLNESGVTYHYIAIG